MLVIAQIIVKYKKPKFRTFEYKLVLTLNDEITHIYNLNAGFSQNQQVKCNKLKLPITKPKR